MNTELQTIGLIDTARLDVSRYTETLLQAAYDAGVYDDETVMAVRCGLFDLLSERLVHITNGESCSVPAETAQAVLSGILYTLDLCLLGCANPDDAAKRLADTASEALYEEGLRLIKRKLQAAELQYRKHFPLFRSLPDSVMRTTAIDGIAGFFRAYHPTAYADVVPITADYPLYLDWQEIGDLRGVTFLGRYLQGLIVEARFLSKFRADTVHAVLSAADPLYRETPSNLFAPLLATAVGMALLRRPFSAWKYGLLADDISAIAEIHERGTITAERLREAGEDVTDLLMLDAVTADYVRRAVGRLCREIVSCLDRQMPMLVFPCTDAKYREAFRPESQISYRGGRMDAEAFRCLDYDLRGCVTAEEKNALILARVQGLEDICDLLTSDTGTLDAAEKRHLWNAMPTEAQQVLTAMCGDAFSENND